MRCHGRSITVPDLPTAEPVHAQRAGVQGLPPVPSPREVRREVGDTGDALGRGVVLRMCATQVSHRAGCRGRCRYALMPLLQGALHLVGAWQ